MEPSEMSSDQIERLRRYYTKEEEFLDEFSQVASVAAHLLEDAWRPQYNCNDATRQQRQYFISSGELSSLVFDGAAVYQTERGFSSAQIVLRTAKRR
jgi:hypothetical protein